jgi:hypothetical protein
MVMMKVKAKSFDLALPFLSSVISNGGDKIDE